MMEHIVQVAIGVDDAAIRKHIMETAETEIKASIKQDVLDELFEPRYYRRHADPKEDPLKQWAKDIIREVIGEYRDEIIAKGTKAFTDRLMSTKAVKAIVSNIISENQNTD